MPLRLMVLTDRSQVRGDLLDVVAAAVEGGATEILLREKDLPRYRRAELAGAILAQCGEPGEARLIVASDVELALEAGAAGVHLAADDPWPGRIRHEGGREEDRLLVGRSCHDENELLAARDEGVDYVTLSPIFATASKPGHGPGLGVETLARLCRKVPDLPVIALGGIGPGGVAPCIDAGAAGIAVMGEMMRADDPATLTTRLLGEATRRRPEHP